MYINFGELPKHTRIWIFQANRAFDTTEQQIITDNLVRFAEQWTAHNQTLQASTTIKYNQFIIIGVNEQHQQASGCSIDKMTHFIQSIEKAFGISLLDRSLVAFMENESIQTVKLPEIKQKVAEGVIKPDTYVFNNTITELEALEAVWKQPAQETWLKKYFN